MQQTVYKCDECSNEIGAKKHISLNIGHSYSGIATPPTKGGQWEVKNKINGKFMHFCNGQCIGRFFSALMKKTV